jgi:hypothetical protein
MSVRLSGDNGNPVVCIKTYRITGGCETTGSCESTGITYTTGTSVTEWCSTRGIFDDCRFTNYIENEHWVQIDTVFVRDEYLDTCDLKFKGGLSTIVKSVYQATLDNNSVSLVIPPTTSEVPYDPTKVEVVNFNEQWLNESNYRKGKFKVYVNGKLFFVINNFEEIIPRPLNTEKEKQIGVPFNISLGGGTQGLKDNLTAKLTPECDISFGVEIDLSLTVVITSGSINISYNLDSGIILSEDIVLSFTHLLGKKTGGYYEIDTSITKTITRNIDL